MNDPNDPNGGKEKKADFSNVESGSSTTAPAPPSPASPQGGADPGESTRRIYVVEPGDSLSRIAKKFYGEAGAWKKIFEANRDRISNPDLIQPGWRLDIPE